MTKGWLAGVVVRGHHSVDQRSSLDLVGDSGGGLHNSLHDWSVVDSAGDRQDKGRNWSWSNGSEGSNWSWSSNEGSGDWDSLTNRVDKTVLEKCLV